MKRFLSLNLKKMIVTRVDYGIMHSNEYRKVVKDSVGSFYERVNFGRI